MVRRNLAQSIAVNAGKEPPYAREQRLGTGLWPRARVGLTYSPSNPLFLGTVASHSVRPAFWQTFFQDTTTGLLFP